MLKVIIVDDEILIRVGVKSCLDWGKYGFEVVGQAEDGIKALDLIEKKKPDIILTDIKMPNMDGLELIRVIRKRYPHIKVIVLSCYNEMDYVKRAMKLGAEDYLLKLSVQPDMLLETMKRVKEVIERERKEELKTNKLEKKISINKQILKDNLYKKFIDGLIEAEELLLALNKLDVNLKLGSYSVVCCRIDGGYLENSLEDQHLREYSFRNIVEEVLEDYCQCDIAEVDNGFYILLVANNGYLNLVEACNKVSNTVKKYLNTIVSFGISTEETKICRLKDIYLQACCALDYMFYYGRGSITQFNEKRCFINDHIFIDMSLENLILNQIENLDADGAWLLIEEFIEKLTNSIMYSPESVKYSFVEVFYALNSLVKKYNLQDKFIYSDIRTNISDILSMETIEDLKVWFKEYIQNLVTFLSEIKLERERPEIAKIKTYILNHLDKNITLENAAAISNLSKAYFSTIFKQEVGESYTDYTNRVKMEKARELICDFGLRCYEAAEKVGISDESYFSKLFKKYIGENPSSIKK